MSTPACPCCDGRPILTTETPDGITSQVCLVCQGTGSVQESRAGRWDRDLARDHRDVRDAGWLL